MLPVALFGFNNFMHFKRIKLGAVYSQYLLHAVFFAIRVCIFFKPIFFIFLKQQYTLQGHIRRETTLIYHDMLLGTFFVKYLFFLQNILMPFY